MLLSWPLQRQINDRSIMIKDLAKRVERKKNEKITSSASFPPGFIMEGS